MKRNNRLFYIGVTLAIVYLMITVFYFFNLVSLPNRYRAIEDATITEINHTIEDTLSTYPIKTQEQLSMISDQYPSDFMVLHGNDVVYQSSENLSPGAFYNAVDPKAILFESTGDVVVNNNRFTVLMRLYQLPDDIYILPFISQQVIIMTVSFVVLVIGFIFLFNSLLSPLEKIKKSLGYLKNYDFEMVAEGKDVVNQQLADLTTQLKTDISTASRQYTESELEIESAKQHLNNTLVVSKSFIHDLKTPIHQLLMINNAILDQDDIEDSLLALAFENKDLSQKVILRINEILKILNEDNRNNLSDPEPFDIVALTYRTLSSFGQSFAAKDLEIILNADESVIVNSNPVLVQLLIHNLLSNIAHYAKKNTSVNIAIIAGENISLEFTNQTTNQNLKRMKQSQVLLNALQDAPASENKYSSGNGLFLVKDLAKLLDGTYTMSTSQNAVTIRITIPALSGNQDEA
ncbi:HAMP domain-containing histidine kinase [Erysipelothrix sp. HDW6C]|uniref:sensor histidine kinase n=1 Tax=Erysipelothrix sp. HDW6C TaxID=2714930 RepID=UPI00140DE25F|nr:HAMP domain-containing histidine kinase [Erysipelothrix sp. HDW6C]QIK69186.1 HAMP domain-containing histidine kinase [Erysipelothrix sp. HDW6C]